jgi:mRNA-degrading endonuclease YafQ of YafQ-DinJ toxin-antitoxin module
MTSEPYRTLDFTDTFLESFGSKEFAAADRKAIRKALGLLDTNEQHPSLRVHDLGRELAGTWSASASDSIRLIFVRTSGGRKTMLDATRHYT